MNQSAISARLSAMDTATLHESGAATIMQTGMQLLSGSRRVAGPALTAVCPPGDNLTIHAAVAAARPGDVLVVQCNDPNYGVWGEVLSVAAMSRGIVALVLDGSVRDLAAIRALDFPVLARGTCLRGTVKEANGVVNVPITCGGALVRPGDIIVGDESGIVVIPPQAAEQIATRAEERVRKEAIMMDQLRSGRTTVQLLGLEGRIK
jgi:4-hydroxy-4-methyl-2-oxoglutarate aldolase